MSAGGFSASAERVVPARPPVWLLPRRAVPARLFPFPASTQRPEASSAVGDALRNPPHEHSFSDPDSERARRLGPLGSAARPEGGTPPKEIRR